MNDRTRPTRRTWLHLLLVATIFAGPAFARNGSAPATLSVEVAEIPGRFLFEGPMFDDGMPAYGATFLTQSWLCPAGTLDGEHGVEADGSPTHPEAVIGRWTCRGWFVGDGVHSEDGPMAEDMLVRYRFELPLAVAR